uniref:Ubiquitin carboxyl-terminal hydrolase n=1 Tax=Corvus moneduloides TaxID=1196302 RepID=A0A8C3H3K8_CORMO
RPGTGGLLPLAAAPDPLPGFSRFSPCRHRAMRNWGVLGGAAAALAAGIYVLWGPITGRKRRRRGLVPGLLNLGNTCFMNSLLQGLSSCPSFIRWLEEFTAQYRTEQEKSQEHQYLSVTLLQLLRALSCQEVTEDDVLDASCLLEVLRMNRWQISSFEEQDAHELFHVLTSSLEDERDRQPRVTHLFDQKLLESDNSNFCVAGSLPPVSNHWKSQHPFHGRLTSNMVCKHCEHQSPVRFDTFDSLSLSIPAAVWGRPMTLDHCLHHFISSESVKDVVCDNCTRIQAEGILNGQSIENQRTTFVKQLKLGKLPQCLCIHLQRLSWSNQGTPLKRHEHVQFNEFLVMDIYKYRVPGPKSSQEQLSWKNSEETTPGTKDGRAGKPSGTSFASKIDQDDLWLLLLSLCVSVCVCMPRLSPCPRRAPLYLYRLMAVVVHHGDMHSGHFVTFRRAPGARSSSSSSSQWLWISDESVRRASLHEVLAASAYLLFYERVHGRAQPQSPAQD